MPQLAADKKYKRILLKLSGEALTGSENFGIDPKILDSMALAIGQLVGIGVQVSWRCPAAGGTGSGDRRSHGDAGHCHECTGHA
jgi:hypothetical protein